MGTSKNAGQFLKRGRLLAHVDAYYREELLPADLLHDVVGHRLKTVLERAEQSYQVIIRRNAREIDFVTLRDIFYLHISYPPQNVIPFRKVTYYIYPCQSV